MKNPRNKEWKSKLAVAVMVAAVPAALFAYTSDDVFDAWSYAIVGSPNTVYSSTYSMAIGENNVVSSNNSLAIGSYINPAYSHNSLTVGTWNQNKTGLRFTVANGEYSGGAIYRNAFEVYEDGSVIVPRYDKTGNVLEIYPGGDVIVGKPQGDISMGAYGD